MLDFDQIRAQYPDHLQAFDRALLREYLQYKILQGIFESKFAGQLAFLGGTALRIVHGNNRFSEGIDLDNFGLDWKAFESLIEIVQRFMELEGYEVEIRNVAKGAYRCTLRFPDVLFEQGISPYQEEKILIQIDTAAQGYDYLPEVRILNKFDVFTQIRVTPVNILLSQKIFAAVNRKRPKGRDFFDITFLLGRTKPDLDFLRLKLGIHSAAELRQEILDRTANLDLQILAQDVAPFVMNTSEIRRVETFREVWKQAALD